MSQTVMIVLIIAALIVSLAVIFGAVLMYGIKHGEFRASRKDQASVGGERHGRVEDSDGAADERED